MCLSVRMSVCMYMCLYVRLSLYVCVCVCMRCATQVNSYDCLSDLNESACVCMCLCVCMDVRVYVWMCVCMCVGVQLALTVDSIDPALHSPVRTDISSEHYVRVSV